MFPRIFHIYGPLWIQSYGTMIALGFMVFLFLTNRHPARSRLISTELYTNLVFGGLLAGLVGGRVLFALSYPEHFSDNWIELFFPWVEGLMIVGAVVGVFIYGLIVLPLYKIKTFALLDLVAAYAPLMQSIARIGCFASGCCYGAPAPDLWCAVTFTDPAGNGPLNIPLHPTQLYLCVISLLIFFITRTVYEYQNDRAGITVFTYLSLEMLGRIIVDFWRADREPYLPLDLPFIKISYVQLWAGILMCGAVVTLMIFLSKHTKKS